MKAGLISLGCSKNRVDSEYLLGYLRARGLSITNRPAEADILIVNTCGFIQPAKEESINTVLEMAQYKQSGACKLLVMTGCLSQRYKEELLAEMPEVDIMWGVADQAGLAAEIARRMDLDTPCLQAERMLSTPFYSAYLRVADGCDNRCAYCAIPLIRGPRRSVPMEALVAEAQRLAEQGVVELTVIAQDTSAYGLDLYGKPMLSELLRRLSRIPQLHWIRVLYTYPDTVDEELLRTIAQDPKMPNYLDMPIQHIHPLLLRRMNRRGSDRDIRDIIHTMRSLAEDFIVRTTVITGFPGETEEQFQYLADFLQEEKLDRLGAFAYSQEEDTPAAGFSEQLSEEIKNRRLDIIMRQQQPISLAANQARIGKCYEVLAEEVGEDYACGRSYAEAPEVDGVIRFKRCGRPLSVGAFTRVRITGADYYDLEGEEL